ncbi:hypothetical protein NPIL_438121, partial [Nephila pilipes]
KLSLIMPFYKVKCVKDSTQNDSEFWTRADFQVSYFDGEQRIPAPDQGLDWAVARDVFDCFRSQTYSRTWTLKKKSESGLRRGSVRLDPLLHFRCVLLKTETSKS